MKMEIRKNIEIMKSVIRDIQLEGFRFEKDEIHILMKIAKQKINDDEARKIFYNKIKILDENL